MIILGCRAKLQAKEVAVAEAKGELQRRKNEVTSVAERFVGALEKLVEAERETAEEQSKFKKEEKLHEENRSRQSSLHFRC